MLELLVFIAIVAVLIAATRPGGAGREQGGQRWAGRLPIWPASHRG